MAKPNFKFQKRQKELERKKKNEEKLQRKLAKNSGDDSGDEQENHDRPSAEEGTL